MDCLGTLGHDLYNELCFGVYETENGHGIRFHRWSRNLVSGLPRDSLLLCFGTIKNSPGLV